MRVLQKTGPLVELQERAVPEPGPGEVVLRLMCAGLCRTDIYVADGLLPSESPRVLGHECSGVICRLGQGVEQSRLGSPVTVFPWIGCKTCEYCRQDEEQLGYLCPGRKLLGWHRDGCFADFMVLPADRCFNLNEGLTFQAGAYVEPIVAALGVLRSPVRKAEKVAVLGLNRIAGLTSTILREYAQCDHDCIDLDDGEENAYDLIVETCATAESLRAAFRYLRPDGVLVLKSRPALDVPWPVRMQVEKEITTIGLGYGSLRLALLLLTKRVELFEPLWDRPVPLTEWEEHFERARVGRESKKTFFDPQAR